MPRTQSDYPRQKKQPKIEDPTRDPLEPRPGLWDQTDSEDRATGYHYEEGLQYVDSSCKDSGECECGGEGGCQCDEIQPPELDMNPFQDIPGYYPEGGNYHEDMPVMMARIAAEGEQEYPFSLKKLIEDYEKVEKIPFQIQLGGKLIEVVVANDTDLYLIYEMQQQVIYGVKGLKQAPLLARMLALLVELWPTSVFEVEDVPKLRSEVMRDFVEWYLEFGEVSPETSEAAQAFMASLKT